MSIWRKAWALLDARERRNAFIVLAVILVSALSSAGMVASIMPFLSVLAEPAKIHSTPALKWLYVEGGFSSVYEFLIALGMGSLVIIIFANLVQIIRTYVLSRYSYMRMHSISYRLLEAYLNQPYEHFITSHSGDMGTQILSESQTVVRMFIIPATHGIASFLTVLALVALLVWFNPLVAVVSLGILGGVYGATFALSRLKISKLGKIRAETNAERFRIATEALGGIKEIKVLGREASYTNRYYKPSLEMARAEASVAVLSEIPQYIVQFVAFGLIIILSLVIVEPQKFDTKDGLSELIPLIGILAFAGQKLMPELTRLYYHIIQIKYGIPALERVFSDLHNYSDKQKEVSNDTPKVGLLKKLELDNVFYSYPESGRPSILDLNLCIYAGEKIGVVGATGAGKTTLVDLLLGLLPPSAGELRIDGQPINAKNLRAWQRSVGYVPQEIYLIDASISENIALGVDPDSIDAPKILMVARIAQLENFVLSELPDGFDTVVGERGIRLSGGQRQRIGIARALYRDADLIVFDEATSALDNLTEKEVMSAIELLPQDTTIVMIAHRLSTVKICDRIMVLEGGRLAGVGTWDELMENCPAFKNIANLG